MYKFFTPSSRRIIVRVISLLLLLLSAGCSGLPWQQTDSGTQTAGPRGADEQPTVTLSHTAPARPKVELTREILYKLLVAEVAGQRGHLDISVRNYLELAEETRDPEIASRATRIAVYARDDEAAFKAATIWEGLDPTNIDAHQVLAVLAVRKGDLDTAMRHFETILNQSAGAIDQKLWVIANLLGKEQDQENVKQVMERLMEAHQDDPEALYAYAHVMSRLGDEEKALEILRHLLDIVPDNVNANISYVTLLHKGGETEAALAWLQDSIKKYPDNFNLRLFYARFLTDIKYYAEAKTQFERLHNEDPDNIDVLYALGLLHLQDNELKKAEYYFSVLSELGERTEETSYYLGRIAEENDDYERAIIWYGNLKPDGSNYFDAQIRIGLIMAKQGKLQEAREHLQGIHSQTPEQKTIQVQAEGELLITEKRYEEAMQVYDQALENNFNLDLLYSRAMLAEKMDRLDILENDLRAIIDRDPNHVQALNALGYTLADRTDRYEEAFELIQRAMELKPDDFYILDSMGWVLYRMGRLDEAVDYLQRALQSRADPEIAAHLGEVLWVKGDREAARKVWDTALQETPEDAHLLDVIKRFNP